MFLQLKFFYKPDLQIGFFELFKKNVNKNIYYTNNK